MNEAMLRTTASPAATWGIVVIMTILAAVLVSAAMAADVYGVRTRKTARTPPREDPVLAESEAPTLPDLAAVPAAPWPSSPTPSLPRQRTGEGDRAERSAASVGSLWDILPGQQATRD